MEVSELEGGGSGMDATTLSVVLLCISVPSTVLYVRVLHILITNRKSPPYTSFFFRVSISQALFDLTYVPSVFACQIAPQFPVFFDLLLASNGTMWPEWAYAYPYFYLHGQTFGVLIISIHRMFSVAKPFSPVTKFLEGIPRPILHAVHIIITLPAIALIFWGQPTVRFAYDNKTHILDRLAQPEAISQNSTIVVISTSVITIICIGCYAIIFMQKSAITGRSRSDLVLLTVSFVLFLFLCLITLYFIALFIVSNAKRLDIVNQMRSVYPVMIAAFSYSSPWMLLMTSAETRRRVLGRWTGSSARVSVAGVSINTRSVSRTRSLTHL